MAADKRGGTMVDENRDRGRFVALPAVVLGGMAYLRLSHAARSLLIDWLHSLAAWTHAVTFTLKHHDERGVQATQKIMKDTARHFLVVLNAACFGASNARRGYRVGSAVSFGWGVYGDHPHLHFSLAAPAHLEDQKFVSLIKSIASRIFWIDQQKKIKPYRDQGWSEYLVDHGMDNVILDLVRPSMPA